MYKAKFLGRTVVLTWQQLRSLRSRFNTRNFKRTVTGNYRNDTACILCSTANNYCKDCPFKVFEESWNTGCLTLINRMLKVQDVDWYCMSNGILYRTEKEKAQIDRVHEFFGRFKKVQ